MSERKHPPAGFPQLRENRILVIAGTRPEIIKLAPVVRALERNGLAPRLCVTGQHDDMAEGALQQFALTPDIRLDLLRAGQSLGALNLRASVALGNVMRREQPEIVIVQGDTSSALCGAIAARAHGAAIAHVEAGLRSFDRKKPFPEEIYRSLISEIADLHFAPTVQARQNLIDEGVDPATIDVTGNSVVDALHWVQQTRPAATPADDAPPLVLVTLHRRETCRADLAAIVRGLAAIAKERSIRLLLPVHPSMPKGAFAPLATLPGVTLSGPLPYDEFIAALSSAHLAITDSGGVQEEACALGIPTLIARQVTERPEVVRAGTARIVGTDGHQLRREAIWLLDDKTAHAAMAQASNAIGDGRAAERIAKRLASAFETQNAA